MYIFSYEWVEKKHSYAHCIIYRIEFSYSHAPIRDTPINRTPSNIDTPLLVIRLARQIDESVEVDFPYIAVLITPPIPVYAYSYRPPNRL